MVFWTGLVKRLKETVSKKYIDDNLNLKADKVNTYTKEQCDNKFGSYTYLNNNYYKKTDSDNRYYTKEQVYSKQESDSRFPSYNYMNNNYYNRTQSDDRYQLKGAGGDYYTKQESDNRYYTKEQSDDRFAKDFQIISLQTQINNKADKSVVDNKADKSYVDLKDVKRLAIRLSGSGSGVSIVKNVAWYGRYKEYRIPLPSGLRNKSNRIIGFDLYLPDDYYYVWSCKKYSDSINLCIKRCDSDGEMYLNTGSELVIYYYDLQQF